MRDPHIYALDHSKKWVTDQQPESQQMPETLPSTDHVLAAEPLVYEAAGIVRVAPLVRTSLPSWDFPSPPPDEAVLGPSEGSWGSQACGVRS